MSDHFDQWQIIAYTGKNRNLVVGRTYVRAATASKAIELGRSALRLIGVRGRFLVEATPYYPQRDWAFSGFISKGCGA